MKRFAGTIVLTLALGLSAFAINTSAAAADIDPDTEAGALALDWKLSLDEATARVQRQGAVTALAVDAERLFGERFGGVWIDHADRGMAVVGFAGEVPVKELEDLAAAHRLSGWVRGKVVDFSLGYLGAGIDELGRQLERANADAEFTIAVGLRTDANRIQLMVPASAEPTAAQQEFLADARVRYGRALREVRQDIAVDGHACAFPNCDTPLRGGVRIAGSVGCTAGYMAKKPDGTKYVLTAGHCLTGNNWGAWWTQNSNGSWRQLAKPVSGGGWQVAWFGGGHADHGVFWLNWAAAENSKPWVYYKSWATDHPIYSVAPNPAHMFAVLGTYLCKTGATSGTKCGSASLANLVITYKSGVTVSGMVWASIKSCPGDSGGPIYSYFTAHGITSGGKAGACGNYVIYSPVKKATQELGVQLMLA